MTLTTLKPGDMAKLAVRDHGDVHTMYYPVTVEAVSPLIVYAAGRAFQVEDGLCVDEYGVRLEYQKEEDN